MSKLLAIALGLGLSAGAAHAQPAYDNPQTGDYAPSTPPPTVAVPAPQSGMPLPAGQWIFTAQYGWVYMPQSASYLNGDYAYVYAPSVGWSWRTAPWMFDVGPRPYYGHGYRHYEHWTPRFRPTYRYHAERFRPERRSGAPREIHRERGDRHEHRG